MKKSKGQTIDLLYTNNKETNKKSKSKKTNSNKKKTKKTQNRSNDIINLDNEIIIGLTPKKNVGAGPVSARKTKKQRDKKSKNVGANSVRPQKNNKNNSSKKKKQKTKNKKLKIFKWLFLIILLLTAIILFLMSSVFNIKQIVIVNNSKVSTEEIINLSTLTTGVNMFKTTNKTIREGIKTNAYIENVKVKRNINGTITLDINERVATYMIQINNNYVYINNQGYMLEISENPLELPIITGFSTPNEEIIEGNRLNNEDLKKLDDIIKIVETSKNTPLANLITEINISDFSDYKLTIASEQKVVKIGEMTNLNIKLQMAGKILEAESGKVGEIYFQENGKKAVFKEEVAR